MKMVASLREKLSKIVAFRGGYPNPQILSSWRFRLSNSQIMLVLSLALFGLSYLYGVNRGMDHMLAGPLDSRAQQIASAISDTAYHLDLRYAVQAQVLATLTKGGMSDIHSNFEPLGLKYPDYISDGNHWNSLLQKAAHLDNISATPRVSDGTLTFIQMEDLGLTDFYKISFQLFGYTVQGFYKTYFLILGIGTALTFAAFWSKPGMLVSANLLLFGTFLSICCLDELDSVSNGRFFATLALLPIFHLMAVMWAPSRMTPTAIVLTAMQMILLSFVITMRSSAGWGVILLAGSITALILWKAKYFWSTEPLKVFVQKSMTWPIVVIVLCFGFSITYQNNKIHPGYFVLDETLPNHLVWHALAYGLSFYPGIETQIPGLGDVRGDGLPTYFGNAYLKESIGFEPPSLSAYYASYFFPQLGRPRTYERVVRAAYINFVKNHPLKILIFTFVTKPKIMLGILAKMLSDSVSRKNTRYFFLASVLLVAAMAFFNPSVKDKADQNFGAVVIGAMALASCLPALIAYPAYLGETFAVWVAGFAALVVIAAWGSWSSLKIPRG
jgi:hypothetical protein